MVDDAGRVHSSGLPGVVAKSRYLLDRTVA